MIRTIGKATSDLLHDALDAFARLDGKQALQIIAADEIVDHEFRTILRNLITFMMEDPRTISSALDTLWVAKAIERVGDHSVIAGGRLEIGTASGRELELEVEPLGPLISLIGGGYGGEHAQGTPKGPLFVDGEVWDLREPGSFARIPHSVLERPCTFRWGDQVGHGCYELCIGEYAPLGIGPID